MPRIIASVRINANSFFIVQDTSVRVMNVIKDNTCLNHRRHLPVIIVFSRCFHKMKYRDS